MKKKVSVKRVFEYIFVFALVGFILFIVLTNLYYWRMEHEHIMYHKTHAQSVSAHNPDISKVAADVEAQIEASNQVQE